LRHTNTQSTTTLLAIIQTP